MSSDEVLEQNFVNHRHAIELLNLSSLNFDACQWWQTRGASSVLWCLRYAFVLSFVETCRTVSGV